MRSSKNSYRTSPLIDASFWISLAFRAVPLPLTDLNPWRVSWNFTAAPIQKTTTPDTAFQMTSMRPIQQNYLFPLGMRTTVFQANSIRIHPSPNVNCMVSTTFYYVLM